MKIFIATTLFLSGIVGSQSQEIHYNEVQVDANPWTGKPGVIRYTKTCEQDSGSPRGKRQAPEEPKQPNCYYHADESITPPDCDGFCNVDSRRKCRDLNGTKLEYTCTRKPVFVPLGKFDICDKFEDNFRGDGKPGPWFNTVGSNYGCASETCCLWFPPIKCADVPLVKYTFLPFIHNGVEYNDCFDAEAVEANSITAAEINEGKNGQRKQVCIFSADLDEEGEVIVDQDGNPTTSYKENTVEFSDCEPSYSPAAGCCKFSPVFE